jgi:UDP-N-acetylmuramate: L-alanyl-gamma-D-glutamyl-meso-diaminopimelate ligase
MRIHFIAIGGAIMHSLAIALHHKGHQITGSDDKIADPALTNLSKAGIMPEQIGFDAHHITADIDAVILGMHARVDNPELLAAQQLGIAVYSFPQYIYEIAKNKKRIVIGGSHGKTTTTGMVMHVLRHAGVDIDYIVGARIPGFESGVRLTEAAPVIVLEGDEYLASPIHRESKFLFYHPDIALITGIAWDHINVFPVYADYVHQFRRFADTVSPDGAIIYCEEDAELKKLFAAYPTPAALLPYHTPAYEVRDHVTYLPTAQGMRSMRVFGGHNMQNIAGARLVCQQMGISDEVFYEGIATFEGATNRLQRLYEGADRAVYRDFAHSPSKLAATVAAMRTQYPDRRMIAVMELHTFSSLTPDFLAEYHHTMDAADVRVLFIDDEAVRLKRMTTPDADMLRSAFGYGDMDIFYEHSRLFEFLTNRHWSNTNLLLMTSGIFGGLDLNLLTTHISDPKN